MCRRQPSVPFKGVNVKNAQWSWTFSTLGCPELNLNGVVDLAKRFNINSLELRMLENNTNLPEYFRKEYREPARLADFLGEQEISVCAIDTSLVLCGAKDCDKEALLEFIPWAQGLGVKYLRVFEGGRSKEKTDPDEISAMVATVNWWRERRNSEGWEVDIMVETHDACVNSRNLAVLQQEVGEPLKILWDTHHPWHQVGEDINDTWSALAQETVHIHIKDSVLDNNTKSGYRYVPPSQGRFPFTELWSLLQKADYRGTVSLEWEKAWCPEIAPLEEALQAMQDNLWM